MLFSYKSQIDNWFWFEAEEVASTNDELKNFPANKFPAVLTAIRQTGGKGRRGRKWQSIDGNLYFTYSQEIAPQELSCFVCLIGLSLAKTVLQLSPDTDIKIKWPNDVFLNHKKLSGILLENIRDNLWAIGIGVNIKGAPEIKDMPYLATSLAENGITIERTAFLRLFLKQYCQDLANYHENGFGDLRKEWLELALNLHKKITIKNDDNVKEGIFLTLDDNGYLILKTENMEERIIAGDLFL